MTKPIIQVLLIEDNATDVLMLREQLVHDPVSEFRLTIAERLSAGLALFQQTRFDVVLLDLGLPDSQGLNTFERVHTQVGDVPVLVFSGFWDEQVAIQAVHLGAQDYLVKGHGAGESAARAIRYAIERQRTQTILHESEERHRLLFQNNRDAVFLTIPNGPILDANATACEMFGYTLDEFRQLGQPFIADPTDPRLAVAMEEQARTGKFFGELTYLRRDGTSFPGDVSSTRFRNRNGEWQTSLIVRDISARKQAEATLNQTLEDLRTHQFELQMQNEELKRTQQELDLAHTKYFGLYELAPTGYLTLNTQGIILETNLTMAHLLGVTRTDLLKQPLSHFILQQDRDNFYHHHQQLVETRTSQTYELRIVRPDGTFRWVNIESKMEQTGDDAPVIWKSLSDITARKQAEEALRVANERFHQVMTQLNDAVWIASLDGSQIFETNQAFEKIYGVSVRDFTTNPELWIQVVHPDDRAIAQASAETLSQTGQATVEYRIRRPDGQIRWLLDRKSILYDDQGKPVLMGGIASDITSRKQAEIALRLSEEQYRGLMESLDNVVATIDYDGKFLYMNDLAAKYLGSTPSALIGKTMHELFPEPIASAQLAAVRQVIKEDKGILTENPGIAQGQRRWFRNSVQPIHNERGEVVYALLNTADIHDLKTAQQQLLELNQTLEERIQERTAQVQDLFDNAPAGYHSLDADGKIVMVNQTELNWLGYTREEMLGRPISDFFTPSGQAKFRDAFSVFKQQGWIQDQEFEFVRKDGTTLPVLISATAIYNTAHEYVMSRSTAVDITERRRAEEAVRESEETYRALFETSTDAIFWMDLDLNYIRVNPRCLEFLGFDSTADLLNHKASEFIEPSQLIDSTNRMQQLLNGESPPAYERTFRRKDGTTVQGEITLSLIRDGKGNPKLVQSVVRDITRRKQAEDTLRRANLEMERALRVKDEFLANMSHELRTPLNAILGLSQSFLEQILGPLDERQLEAVRTIEASGTHLLALINDILDLSKIQAGNVRLDVAPVEVKAVCQASLLLIKQIAHKKQIKLTLQIDVAVEWIAADQRLLKQMLVNLLSNAVKFTPAGGRIELVVSGDAENRLARFAVHDTGIGIATDDIARLFKPFVQLDGGLARRHEGAGLGLALVARMADLHGGKVEVTSQVGEGSCFTIVLPWSTDMQNFALAQMSTLDAHVAVKAPSAQPANAHAPLILIAEDNEANLVTLSIYLQAKGYRVVLARHGGEAMDLARAEHPKLILMDLQMPVLDGLEVTHRLRSESDPQIARVPIIALTALAMPGDREQAIAAGANAYMSKPVNLKQLLEMIQGLIES